LVLSSPFPPSLTVEFDEDDVSDSRKDGSPCASMGFASAVPGTLPFRLRDKGGRVLIGLGCRIRGVIPSGATIPGDCDDIEVGVVSRLYDPGPGDSENLVDVALYPLYLLWLLRPEPSGVGGGRSWVASL
jgi:hypothetical protein